MVISLAFAASRQVPGNHLGCPAMSGLRSRIWCCLAVLAALAAMPWAAAQEPASEGRKPKGRKIRLLAVGDEPLFRAEVRDGVLQELELEEGVIPPPEVTARVGKDTEVATAIQLGGFSNELRVPKGLSVLRLRDSREPESKTWTTVAVPEGDDPLLVLLWRDPKVGKWSRARHVVLRDGTARAPVGSLRVVNVTGALVALKFEGQQETVGLKPGRSFVRRIGAGNKLPVSVAVQQPGGGWLPLFQSEVEPGRADRSLLVVYRSDGESPRRPANAKLLTERVAVVAAGGG
jgi:hypothetical protein